MVRKFTFLLISRGSCLKHKNANFNRPNIIISFIVYELDTWSRNLKSEFTLKDCLFWGVKLAKNADTDKYIYPGYSIRFNSGSEFSLPDSSVGKNVIILGDDMSILIIRKNIF